MSYPFAVAVSKARKSGYASLTEGEKWDWHADVYGYRRLVVGAPIDEHVSPCDTAGDWFDERRARIAEAHYRAKFGDRHNAKHHQREAAE